ncbi:hypothetical protein RRU01S_13_00240 [Agrobacterium rubi TR3 = NBRC 13261]|uniref:Uncharacterized protein n=1 Tax=Agrobacterium rubi TR3 = NBRC 13261 TaxID=1368415 RepID=A0A081CVJ0_9HYPH|nr:hypothetical protein [Agrobacterium rubi]MBP1877648.1 hypothetical protein [Agrobacterium rubi]GAK70686.1 hypothetical protein RRU01S_13_00240 [Agrobacterium rubi TR3 = NBRC 13261]
MIQKRYSFRRVAEIDSVGNARDDEAGHDSFKFFRQGTRNLEIVMGRRRSSDHMLQLASFEFLRGLGDGHEIGLQSLGLVATFEAKMGNRL